MLYYIWWKLGFCRIDPCGRSAKRNPRKKRTILWANRKQTARRAAGRSSPPSLAKEFNRQIKEGEICFANRHSALGNKNERQNAKKVPTVGSLRAENAVGTASEARKTVVSIFDEGTFVETGALIARRFGELPGEGESELAGVVTGYGAVDGKLTCAFLFDATRMKGAVDGRTADKIVSLYDMAKKNGAPVVGVFDSVGANIFEGVSALAAYGRILSAVAGASGVIPQIALISGKCIGTLSAVAATFDIALLHDGASLYVTDPALTGEKDGQAPILSAVCDPESAAARIRSLISFLPPCAGCGISVFGCSDDLNRRLAPTLPADADGILAAIADGGRLLPVSNAGSLLCSFAEIGGVRCGIVLSDKNQNEGRIDAFSARIAARFVDFCDAFSLPVVTLVDSAGLAASGENERAPFSSDLARLALAYAGAGVPCVTVILGRAIGAAFALLGSRSLGADVAYAVEGSEIGALPADAAVAFAFEDALAKGKTKEELRREWMNMIASPVAAAATGEIDDVIPASELRCRVASALLMLSAKGTVDAPARAIRPF